MKREAKERKARLRALIDSYALNKLFTQEDSELVRMVVCFVYAHRGYGQVYCARRWSFVGRLVVDRGPFG